MSIRGNSKHVGSHKVDRLHRQTRALEAILQDFDERLSLVPRKERENLLSTFGKHLIENILRYHLDAERIIAKHKLKNVTTERAEKALLQEVKKRHKVIKALYQII